MSQSSAPIPVTESRAEQLSHKQASTNQAQRILDGLTRIYRGQTLILGGPCWPMDEVRRTLAPREGSTIRVLDVGSEISVWASDIAKEFPHTEILSIDTVANMSINPPPNSRSEVVDLVNDDISHLHGQFDLVHFVRPARIAKDFYPILEKVLRALRPGGLFLLNDGDTVIYDENRQVMGPAYSDLDTGKASWWARYWRELQVRFNPGQDIPHDTGDSLDKWFSNVDILEDKKSHYVYVPLGQPGAEEEGVCTNEEVLKISREVLLEVAWSARPRLIEAGMPEAELDHILREGEADFSRLRMYSRFSSYAARLKAN